jgi:hypothetical protein
MADHEHPQRGLSPAEVAARVAAILAAAERDAREIIDAALGDAPPAERPSAHPPAPPTPAHTNGGAPASLTRPPLDGTAYGLAELAARIDQLEAKIDARIDVLWRVLSPGSAAAVEHAPVEPVQEPTPEAGTLGRSVRIHAVDLALRGYSREQIAEELRESMTDRDVERLLDEVLDRE